jgi:hypothetical protein
MDISDILIVILGAIMVIFAVGSVAACVAFIFYDYGFDVGTGEQIGYISEVEYTGWLWQPATIKLISIEPTFSSSDTSWHYGSASGEITEKAKTFMKTHEKVIVTYEVRRVADKWEYSNRVIATGIRQA